MPPYPAPHSTEPYILLVDDDRHMRLYLKSRLAFLGGHIHMVLDGGEGLEVLAERRPHLILSDAVMPRMDGFEFCRQVKQDPRLARIPFVILTSLSQNVRQRSLDAGADDYLSKSESDLVFRIRTRLLLEIGMRTDPALEPELPAMAPSVLVASHSLAVQTQLLTHLSKDALQVRGVPSLAEVMDNLRQRPTDALLLDLEGDTTAMRVLISNLRSHPDFADLPIMILASKDQEAALEPLELDIQDRLLKPLDGVESRHRVKLLLRLNQTAVPK